MSRGGAKLATKRKAARSRPRISDHPDAARCTCERCGLTQWTIPQQPCVRCGYWYGR